MTSPVRHKESALKTAAHLRAPATPEAITIGLGAAICAVRDGEPMVAVVGPSNGERPPEGGFPCGAFSPREHHSLEDGLRAWVQQQTGLKLASASQLCTLGGDTEGGHRDRPPAGPLVISVCYLGLVGPAETDGCDAAIWRSWYSYFPWEDWRNGKPECLGAEIEPHLKAWAAEPPQPCQANPHQRSQRLRLLLGGEGAAWDEEKVLERYDLMCEAGLIGEAVQGAGPIVGRRWPPPRLWHPLLGNHTRVLAAAIGELRRAVKHRPAVFELMPDEFTLFELQKTVEAVLGPHLHKQNFRRLVEGGGLVEATGEYRFRTGGRPAQLYRFRRDVLLEGLTPGVRVKAGRAWMG